MRSCYDCYIRPKSSKIVCLCEIKEVVMVDRQVHFMVEEFTSSVMFPDVNIH